LRLFGLNPAGNAGFGHRNGGFPPGSGRHGAWLPAKYRRSGVTNAASHIKLRCVAQN
jgi:hypothetical protein